MVVFFAQTYLSLLGGKSEGELHMVIVETLTWMLLGYQSILSELLETHLLMKNKA